MEKSLVGVCFLLICLIHGVFGHPVVKRADDIDPLETVVERLTQDLTSLKAEVQAIKNAEAKRAAFHVWLPGAGGGAHVPANTPIRFTRVYEVGNGYDANTGVYTIPVSGVYAFQFQMYPMHTGDYRVDLMQNGHMAVRSGCYDGSASLFNSCASGATLHANAGDRIWLQTNFADDYWTTWHSFLTGVLVSPD